MSWSFLVRLEYKKNPKETKNKKNLKNKNGDYTGIIKLWIWLTIVPRMFRTFICKRGGWVGVNLFAVEINRTILHANVMKHQRKDAWTAIVNFVSYRPLFLVAKKP